MKAETLVLRFFGHFYQNDKFSSFWRASYVHKPALSMDNLTTIYFADFLSCGKTAVFFFLCHVLHCTGWVILHHGLP